MSFETSAALPATATRRIVVFLSGDDAVRYAIDAPRDEANQRPPIEPGAGIRPRRRERRQRSTVPDGTRDQPQDEGPSQISREDEEISPTPSVGGGGFCLTRALSVIGLSPSYSTKTSGNKSFELPAFVHFEHIKAYALYHRMNVQFLTQAMDHDGFITYARIQVPGVNRTLVVQATGSRRHVLFCYLCPTAKVPNCEYIPLFFHPLGGDDVNRAAASTAAAAQSSRKRRPVRDANTAAVAAAKARREADRVAPIKYEEAAQMAEDLARVRSNIDKHANSRMVADLSTRIGRLEAKLSDQQEFTKYVADAFDHQAANFGAKPFGAHDYAAAVVGREVPCSTPAATLEHIAGVMSGDVLSAKRLWGNSYVLENKASAVISCASITPGDTVYVAAAARQPWKGAIVFAYNPATATQMQVLGYVTPQIDPEEISEVIVPLFSELKISAPMVVGGSTITTAQIMSEEGVAPVSPTLAKVGQFRALTYGKTGTEPHVIGIEPHTVAYFNAVDPENFVQVTSSQALYNTGIVNVPANYDSNALSGVSITGNRLNTTTICATGASGASAEALGWVDDIVTSAASTSLWKFSRHPAYYSQVWFGDLAIAGNVIWADTTNAVTATSRLVRANLVVTFADNTTITLRLGNNNGAIQTAGNTDNTHALTLSYDSRGSSALAPKSGTPIKDIELFGLVFSTGSGVQFTPSNVSNSLSIEFFDVQANAPILGAILSGCTTSTNLSISVRSHSQVFPNNSQSAALLVQTTESLPYDPIWLPLMLSAHRQMSGSGGYHASGFMNFIKKAKNAIAPIVRTSLKTAGSILRTTGKVGKKFENVAPFLPPNARAAVMAAGNLGDSEMPWNVDGGWMGAPRPQQRVIAGPQPISTDEVVEGLPFTPPPSMWRRMFQRSPTGAKGFGAPTCLDISSMDAAPAYYGIGNPIEIPALNFAARGFGSGASANAAQIFFPAVTEPDPLGEVEVEIVPVNGGNSGVYPSDVEPFALGKVSIASNSDSSGSSSGLATLVRFLSVLGCPVLSGVYSGEVRDVNHSRDAIAGVDIVTFSMYPVDSYEEKTLGTVQCVDALNSRSRGRTPNLPYGLSGYFAEGLIVSGLVTSSTAGFINPRGARANARILQTLPVPTGYPPNAPPLVLEVRWV